MPSQSVEFVLDKTKALQGLTPKQERFALAMHNGAESATDAYRQSYNVRPGTKVETVQRKAIEVKANGKVVARIRQLSEAIEAEFMLDANKERNKILTRLFKHAADEDPKISLKAIAIAVRIPALGIMKEPDNDGAGDDIKDSDLRKRLIANLDKLIASERDKEAKRSDKAKVIDHEDDGD